MASNLNSVLLVSFGVVSKADIIQLTARPGMVLELNGNSPFPNSVDLQQQNNNENQKLTWNGNQIQVSNRPNLCLCAPSFANGARLQFNSCGACPNQGDQWTVSPYGSPRTISPVYAGNMCVDVEGCVMQNFQPIQLWACVGTQQQSWTRIASLAQSNTDGKNITDSALGDNGAPVCGTSAALAFQTCGKKTDAWWHEPCNECDATCDKSFKVSCVSQQGTHGCTLDVKNNASACALDMYGHCCYVPAVPGNIVV